MSAFPLSAFCALAVHDNGDQSGAKGVSIVEVGVDAGGDRLSVTGQRIGQELKEIQELG